MTDILCIGSVLWDVPDLVPDPMKHGFDRAGHIRRHPGGVAYNIAKALKSKPVPRPDHQFGTGCRRG